MKKIKHQPISEPTVEPNISSMALILQQFRKETEKKEAATESAKVRCRICFKEIAPIPRCFGHGGGGGGDYGNTSEEKASSGDSKSLINPDKIVDNTRELIREFMEGSEGLESEFKSDEESLDPKVIAELVAKGLLTINNDRESMTLTINLQCALKSLSESQRRALKKFMEAIVTEFNAFKEQHHLSDDCINMIQDKEGNILSLCISLPTLTVYDAFIRQLANNLLPIPTPKDDHKETRHFSPNPLPMEPKPSHRVRYLVQDEVNNNEDNGECPRNW